MVDNFGRLMVRTYKKPMAKTSMSPNFCRLRMLMVAITGIGKRNVMKSVIICREVIAHQNPASRHEPSTVQSQALARGVHITKYITKAQTL